MSELRSSAIVMDYAIPFIQDALALDMGCAYQRDVRRADPDDRSRPGGAQPPVRPYRPGLCSLRYSAPGRSGCCAYYS